MNTERMRYIYHLDTIRIKKNMTVSQLCENICSERQFRKYLSGDNNISDSRISEFCDKLNISTRDFYYSLNINDTYEYDQIKKIYNLIKVGKYQEVSVLLDEFNNLKTLTNQNRRYLDYCILRFNHGTKRIYLDEAIQEGRRIANYPECKNNDVFDFVDLLTLLYLSTLEVEQKKTDALDLLQKILSSKELTYLSAENRNVIPPIYSTVSIMLGRLGMYQKSLDVAELGIDFCVKYSFSNSLTWLYYSRAQGNLLLGNTALAELNVVLCMSNVIASQKTKDIVNFYSLLNRDFKKDPFLMILNHKEQLLGETEKKD